MKDKEWIYILDYSVGKIYELEIKTEEDIDIEDILYNYGFNPDCCSYMICNHRITYIESIDD